MHDQSDRKKAIRWNLGTYRSYCLVERIFARLKSCESMKGKMRGRVLFYSLGVDRRKAVRVYREIKPTKTFILLDLQGLLLPTRYAGSPLAFVFFYWRSSLPLTVILCVVKWGSGRLYGIGCTRIKFHQSDINRSAAWCLKDKR